jgi:hypothetical protein
VVGSLAPWLAHADAASPAAVGVVDAFLDARTARDTNAETALFNAEAHIVDGSRDQAIETGVLSELLPPGEAVEFGPRHQPESGEVTWTETVVDSGRPSWENNPNWWVDGSPALQVLASVPPIAEAGVTTTTDTRYMRADVTQARIMRLTMSRVAPVEASSSVSERLGQSLGPLAFAAGFVLFGCALTSMLASEPEVPPASDGGWLVQGLNGWLAERQRAPVQNPVDSASASSWSPTANDHPAQRQPQPPISSPFANSS